MSQDDNEYDNCDFEESTDEQNAKNLNQEQLKQSLENMTVEELVKLMSTQKARYDSNREQFMRLTQQS